MLVKKVFLGLLLICDAISLKMHLIDEDYVEVLVGTPGKLLKLMIDPVAPFSYLFADTKSYSFEEYNKHKEKFFNVFGTFEGVWQNDFFYFTEEKLFNFRMDYVKITTKESRLDCDGVIGLGYWSERPNANIYEILKSMKNVMKVENVLSYNKEKKILTIGEIPYRSNNNPRMFQIYERKNCLGNFIKLDSIGFLTDKNWSKSHEVIEIGDDALLTLMPLIVAPKDRVDFLKKNYLPKLFTPNTTVKYMEDTAKFYTDVFYSDPEKYLTHTEVLFRDTAYQFTPYEKKEKNGYRAMIRFGDIKKNEFKYWYIGLDVINAERVDFDFDKKTVKLYSKSAYKPKYPRYWLLFEIIIYISIFSAALVTFLRIVLFKKKQKDIKKGEELIEL